MGDLEKRGRGNLLLLPGIEIKFDGLVGKRSHYTTVLPSIVRIQLVPIVRCLLPSIGGKKVFFLGGEG